MKQALICPTCQGKLKIEHYNHTHSSGATLALSRLICTLPCEYKKEFAVPEVLFSQKFKQDTGENLEEALL